MDWFDRMIEGLAKFIIRLFHLTPGIALVLMGCCLMWLGGCAICEKPTGAIKVLCNAIVKPPAPPVEEAYIVREGQREERTLDTAAGASLAFKFTPARDGSAALEDVAAWICGAEDCDGWNGGNPVGQLGVRLNAYDAGNWKMKVIGPSGKPCGEPKLRHPWKAGQTYDVRLEARPGLVRLTVDDAEPIEQACDVPARVTIGRGWPPSKRHGALGAREVDTRWSGP